MLIPSSIISGLRAASRSDYALSVWLQGAAADIGGVVRDVSQREKARKLQLPDGAGVCSPLAPLFDSEGRVYRVEYKIVAADENGRGAVTTSNFPHTFRPNADYPAAFQARDLSNSNEIQKIRKIAEVLDPLRLLWTHSDPTLGAPVVWEHEGRAYVLGGNGRTLALLMSSDERYADYLALLKTLWPVLPMPRLAPGQRAMLIRSVRASGGRPLTLAETVRLAGASQESTAAQESPLGRALSTVRSLGIADIGDLYPFVWDRELTADPTVVEAFQEKNPQFWNDLMLRIGEGRRTAYNEPHRAVELIRGISAAFLPEVVRKVGFKDEKTELAVLGAMPMIVSLAGLIRAGEVKPKWDLLPAMADASAIYEIVSKRGTPIRDIPALLEVEARQTSLIGMESPLAKTSILGFLLGAGLARAAGRADPEAAICEILRPYYAAAVNDVPQEMSMFAANESDPVAALALAVRVRLPERLPPGVRRLPERENPRRRTRRPR
jgi:hypothetical protein